MTGRTVRVALGGLLLALVSGTVQTEAETSAARFDGRPTFSEGEALGYFVWRDGDTWKVRWTTFGAEHRFNGRVTLDGGRFTSLKRIDVDTERRVIAPGRPARVVRGPAGRVRGVRGGRGPVVATRDEDVIVQENEGLVRFNTRTDDDIDGFDVEVNAAARGLRLFLEIDGVPQPDEIEVGRENFKPREHPVVVLNLR